MFNFIPFFLIFDSNKVIEKDSKYILETNFTGDFERKLSESNNFCFWTDFFELKSVILIFYSDEEQSDLEKDSKRRKSSELFQFSAETSSLVDNKNIDSSENKKSKKILFNLNQIHYILMKVTSIH